jgi:hypothetical protein
MSSRTAIAVLLVALSATLALGTIYRTIGKPGGGPTDHPTFADATNWLTGRTITEEVVFDVYPGVYPEQVAVSGFQSSVLHPVRFRSQSGGQDVEVTGQFVLGELNTRLEKLVLSGGLVVDGCDSCWVVGCRVSSDPAVQIDGPANGNRLIGNEIIGLPRPVVVAGNGRMTSYTRLYNNFVLAGESTAAVYFHSRSGVDELKHNTILGCTALVYQAPGPILILDNILMAVRGGFCLHSSVTPSVEADYNCLWNAGDGGVVSSGTIVGWDAWQAAGHDIHGMNSDPLLAMGTPPDLHLTFESPCIRTGAPVGVLNDIDGEPRLNGWPPEGPCIGADEVADTSCGRVDLGVSAIESPVGQVPVRAPICPRIVLHNYDGDCHFSVLAVAVYAPDGQLAYEAGVAVGNFLGGTDTTICLPCWTAAECGRYLTRAVITAPDDVRRSNDTLESEFRVVCPHEQLDAAAVSITKPVGTVCGRDTIEPVATVRNLSSIAQSFNVRFSIGEGPDWTSGRTTPVLQPGEECDLVFDIWLPAGPGTFSVKCSTELDGDVDNSNDRLVGSAVKVLLWDAGWVEMAPIPWGPQKRGITDGAWLAHGQFEQYIYAVKGDRTNEFYRYDIDGNSWQGLAPIPWGREGKLPFMGARGIRGDSCYIYATKGHETFGFWRYDIERNEWIQLADVPARPTGDTKVSYGTDLTYVPGDSWRYGQSNDSTSRGYVYLLKGHSGEFYRYNVSTGEWEERQHAPPDKHNELWKAGSFITFDGDRTIYAHRSFANEVWTFDVVDQEWSGAPMSGMPGVQSQDGGCGDWYRFGVFALKGGDTREFRAYLADPGVWFDLDDMPKKGVNKQPRNVFWGADIVSHGCGAFFALKGHDTPEFWRYVLVPGRLNGGQDAGLGNVDAGLPAMVLASSPFAGRAMGIRYSLPVRGPAHFTVLDVAGREVLRRDIIGERVGRCDLDLQGVSAGVYIVRLSSTAGDTKRKLVIQR